MKPGLRLGLALALATATSLGAVSAVQAGVPRADRFTSLCGAMDGTHPATLDHVMFILFENRSYHKIGVQLRHPRRV
jgi:hypothetical protein